MTSITPIQAHKYALTVWTENYVPPDVLVEHLAVALQSLNFTGRIAINMAGYEAPNKVTPFSNPNNVVFDDEPQLEPYSGPQPLAKGEDVITKSEVEKNGFPNLLAFLDLRGKNRGAQ